MNIPGENSSPIRNPGNPKAEDLLSSHRFWDDSQVPHEDDEIFKTFRWTRSDHNIRSAKPCQALDEESSAWHDCLEPQCSFSFGDNGTTATVNAFGRLMQFSSFMNIGHTGMFAADQERTEEPCDPWARAKTLEALTLSRDSEGFSYGLRFDNLNFAAQPERKYVHSRWPRYEFENEQFGMAVQWMVSEGIILQQCVVTNRCKDDELLKFAFDKKMRIRDLDHLDVHYRYNEYKEQPSDKVNVSSKGPNGYSWTCTHAFDTDAVGVVVSISVDGIPCLWDDSFTWHHVLKGFDTIEITTAYKMIPLNGFNTDWREFLIPADKIDVDSMLQAEQFCPLELDIFPIQLSGSLNGIFQRNLEHILSVCAIPTVRVQGKDVRAVALTCGDISAHRIFTSASFFAFRFLLQIAEHLSNKSNHPYLQSLSARIKYVCTGHLLWLKSVAIPYCSLLEGECFVNGTKDKSQSTYARHNLPTDTPFQVLKAADFAAAYKLSEDQELAHELADQLALPWVAHLQKLDKREKFAWPHAEEEGFNIFRLSDHVWIYEALKRLETLRVWDRICSRDGVNERHIDKAAKKFSSKNVQKEFLRRFTTETQNNLSDKRMLAVTRSVRESRFLFHSRDTNLFSSMGIDCENTSFHELWQNTIQAQIRIKNKPSDWDKSLRYGLAIVMGSHGYSLDERAPIDMVKNSVEILIKAIRPNGCIAGQLDKDTRMQVLFSTRGEIESYFHASFEIPHILLSHGRELRKIYSDQSNHFEPNIITKRHAEIGPHGFHNTNHAEEEIDESAEKRLKRTALFSSGIDSKNISELDDEWLYNIPPCCLRDQTIGLEELQELQERIRIDGESHGKTVAKGAFNEHSRAINLDCAVIDLSGRTKRKESNVSFCDSHVMLWNELRKPRTAKAKKRRICVNKMDAYGAMLCYIATPEPERVGISLFFDRHAGYETYFFDDANRLLNTWETELHLSFYMLVDSDIPYDHNLPTYTTEVLPGFHDKVLTRVSMSFLFNGEFFDQYWTCYVINHAPGGTPLISDDSLKNISPSDGSQRQRKVLELRLVDHMLTLLTGSTKRAFATISTKLDIDEGEPSSQEYMSKSIKWQRYQRVLHLMQEDLDHALRAISDWDRREEDRGTEKPRWTRNAERKYGTIINKLAGTTNRKIRELRQTHTSIVSLRGLLKSHQEQLSHELGRREAKESQNVLYLTYISAVFLPLNFATSLFSMSQSPDSTLISNMAKCAAVAFVVTLIALFNASGLAAALRAVRSKLHNVESYCRSEVQKHPFSSQIRKDPDFRNDPDAELCVGREKVDLPAVLRGTPNIGDSLFMFWIEYLFIELPMRRVLYGFGALRWGVVTPKAIVQVSGAVVFLPLFALSWSVRFIYYNLADLFHLCRGFIASLPKRSYVKSDCSTIGLQDEDESMLLKRYRSRLEVARPLTTLSDRVSSKHENRVKDVTEGRGCENRV
ncbi:uncharacterized protein F4822DRAFT_425554 [Hypoxylon trugodes]|uniref:uncharacterized protein n=1 Tax=Hypoxylon trugodes TaxID=326681 RepID=UPI0021999D5E|nr:uncharacterized protein F4822DRAFT_425554 [Hypoxylon trugodes]KAI1392344.1 hypothetical protein F4822DRAFT_425554 [Hypoxylon trugodes]